MFTNASVKLKASAFFVLLFFGWKVSFAQKTFIYSDPMALFNQGMELFEKEKFSAAQRQFNLYSQVSTVSAIKSRAAYLSAVCAVELGNGDALGLLRKVQKDYASFSVARLAIYQQGKWYYRNKDTKQAIVYFDKTVVSDLSTTDAKEFYFMYGYCLFKQERFEDAQKSFAPIKDEKSKYYDAANYYYAYVCYRQAKYNEALEHFARVKSHKTFGPMSSVYIAQIYFARKQYADVIRYCDTITNITIADDVSGLLGQSYYYLNEYAKALPYLERFAAKAPVQPTNSDFYRMAFAYYKSTQWEKAIEQFQKLTDTKDTIAQFALYYLAWCYQETNKKAQARTAFNKVYDSDAPASMRENALYYSAKLAFELGQNNAALITYEKFIKSFPESDRMDEMKSDLSELLLSARNYKEALTILESLNKPSKKDLIILQKVNYLYAEQLFINNEFEKAQKHYIISTQSDFDAKIMSQSYFWLAEIAYRQLNWKQAADYLLQFQQNDAQGKTGLQAQASYNLAYANLKLEKYSEAIEQFRNYIRLDPNLSNPEMYTDAVSRTADCYFVQRNYDKAIEYYRSIIKNKLNGADYALYQIALIQGVQNKFTDKIETLKQLINNYPVSVYIDDALFERANVYLQMENYSEALSAFNEIISKYKSSIYIRKAMLNKALVLFNQGNDDDALEAIKTLVTTFPGSDESREALVLVRNILVNKGESEKLENLYKSIPQVSVSPGTQDSINYEAAFNNYRASDFAKASKGFANYINRFPGGYFILKANFYKAESDYKLKNYDSAYISYTFVVSSTRSDFTERSTRQAAVISYMKKDFNTAFDYYSQLERIASNKDNLYAAIFGQMRCAGLLSHPDSAAQCAFKYINSGMAQKDGLPEARLYTGRFYLSRNKPDSAFPDFQYVLKETKNVLAAEAKYSIAYIQYLRKELKTAQKTITELSEAFQSYDYWVAKGYILWADIYLKLNDTFQAKATLQSVIEGYEGKDELHDIAVQKLNKIQEDEGKKKDDQKKKIEERIQSND